MKRCRENQLGSNNIDLERSIAIASYLLVLSHGQTTATSDEHHTGRVFECKTCNRQFPSFQALGGHRASHKKPRLSSPPSSSSPDHATEKDVVKGKVHECSICGLEFGAGQALGGHMRRHRAALAGSQFVALPLVTDTPFRKTSVLSLDLNLTPLENENSYFRI